MRDVRMIWRYNVPAIEGTGVVGRPLLLAAQATALHYASMECLHRAMLPQQPADLASKLRKDGANLSRGMTDMLEALDRKRGKGPQVVRVERVVVQEGGQAIVGNVAQSPITVPTAALSAAPPAPLLEAFRAWEPVPASLAERGEA